MGDGKTQPRAAMESECTATRVAEWMLEELRREGFLDQQNAVSAIAEKLGERFTYLNENGYPAIGKDVLAAFRKLSEESVVWEREDRRWRLRGVGDKAGRQQD